jgi:type I restriction enzyme S subunit
VSDIIPLEKIEGRILLIRGHKVMLDADLAELYGVTTKRLNEQVKRNRDRFPDDFMFQLTGDEKDKVVANCDHLKKLRFSYALPYVFTEHGAIMLATILNSEVAVKASIQVVRAFVKLREMMATHKDLARKLIEMEKNTTPSLRLCLTPSVSLCPLLKNRGRKSGSEESMNNSNGFKMTEIGFVPEDWEVKKLGDAVSKTKQKDPAKTPDWQFKYIDVSGVNRESLTVEDYNIYFGKEAPSRAKKLVETGDVIFATVRPTLKRVALIEEDFNGHICSTAFCVLRANGKKVIPQFLYFVVSREVFINELGKVQRGASYPAVTDTDVKNQKIPLPSLPEQQKIASVLSAIQKAKEKTENVIRATKELKKSMLKHLFTYGPVPVEEAEKVPLKETEIGMIPEHWDIVRLEEVADIVYGVQAAVAHLTDPSIGIPILTNINIKNEGYIDLSTLRYYKLPESKRNKLILQKGDALFNWRSGSKSQVGKTALFNLDGDYTFSSFILRFRVNNKINNVFLVHYLQSIKEQGFFSTKGDQSSVNAVFNASLSAKIPVFLPPLPEQKQIDQILSAIDKKIATEESKKIALDTLFKTLLSLLMTGNLRVKDLEIPI